VSLARPAPVRFVALGDSYTIGTGIRTADERWPDQLVARLRDGPWPLDLVANLGVNGFTSQDLVDVELPRLAALEPEFASVLIGVNDVVQGIPERTYRDNVAVIFEVLLRLLPPTRVVAVTTPDYTVTQQGAEYGDPTRQSAAIRRFNAAFDELAGERGIALVDVYDVSLAAAMDRSLVAGDGLHPSGAQYARWVDRIAPVVQGLFGI
jgi:lysophospholipase L1-like esterase